MIMGSSTRFEDLTAKFGQAAAGAFAEISDEVRILRRLHDRWFSPTLQQRLAYLGHQEDGF